MAEKPSRDPLQSVLAPTVVVKRKKKAHGHGHHGGAWKIAYADFVTAMMAFFLLMWLLGSTSKYDKEGIEQYFNTPLSALFGNDGGASAHTSVIAGGGRDLSSTRPGEGNKTQTQPVPQSIARAAVAMDDLRKLQQLKQKLMALIEQTPALRAYKDQIRIAITSEGLRIEIVDSLKRPMFASGSSRLESYVTTILTNIGASLNDVDNRVSIAGHTDAVPYSGGQAGYSNWELSSERANAARRALVAGGMKESKVLQVRGLSDVLPLNKDVVDEPTNRRISILVLNKAAEQAFFRDGGRTTVDETRPVEAALPAPVSVKSDAPAAVVK
ncbi:MULTISPECIES: flagellar motor protein MotB [Caballeronia]|jgi:chemotaxis protein MotB|uniref:Flagellar motor protein MotB n=1 Tax=Caballeronia zhejiangensis TaxID=871203 RepID=A0A656QPC3_9BURK|nr:MULTISPECIES: flagellar motor protein MotB [Caballeronia]EKS66785.1 OmpA/MotB family outer membrane protein [Burkholderia sp. SJ98]KDR30545.1 flagellar motor protein MotB [Caballeronia zhejiangensis]MCG7402078.1 flagellar motor protein MotB [Caballeronia zhejiangensis]MCI1042517.1 flagellar motor protein MotB [Caballeronia zhejiangensis]MDR5768540.1 flagellar motor protein MotB [Caballeronia sp. LZ028]